MDERERRILLEEKRKLARIKRGSRWMKKSASGPNLDLEENPFCATKQKNDWKERHKSPILARELQKKKYMKQSSGNKLLDILRDTMDQINSDQPLEPGRLRTPKQKKRRPQSPASPHKHFDVLSLMRDAEALQKRKMDSEYNNLPRAGLMSADDLFKLIHAPPSSGPAFRQSDENDSKKTKRNGKKSDQTVLFPKEHNKQEKAEWNDSIIDPIMERLQRKGKERTSELQVNALSGAGFRKGNRDLKTYTKHLNRLACGIRDAPFCLDRQQEDEREMAYLNYHCTFPDLDPDLL